MIPQNTQSHARVSMFHGLQPTTTPNPLLSVTDLYGIGFGLIILLVVSRQLVVRLYAQHQLHRLIRSLQRRVMLERQLHRKAFQAAPKNGLSR